MEKPVFVEFDGKLNVAIRRMNFRMPKCNQDQRRGFRVAVTALVLAMWGLSCVADRDEPVLSEGVVATVGSFEISDRHFTNQLKRFYLRTGQAVNLNEEVRLGVLDARIERYAIVEYAREQGWDREPDALYNRALIERKVLMEAYQRHFIYDLVEVTESHEREVFRRYNTTLRASHLFAETRRDADSLYNLLQNGATFESLAPSVFRDPELASSGGDLGYFSLDEMDIAFEEQAYSMQPGQISAPVKTSRGYSIIKLTEVAAAPMLTETEFARRRSSLRQVARAQQEELATRADIRQVTSAMDWNEAGIDVLWELISENSSLYQAHNPELNELPLPVDDGARDVVLARYQGFRFTVGDFLTEAYYTTPARRAQASGFDQFREQLEGMVYRSYALGLINNYPSLDRAFIQGSIEETFYGYLFERFEGYIDQQVRVDEAQVRAAFDSYPEEFASPLHLEVAEMVFTSESTAERVAERLRQGASFEEQLQEYGAPVESKRRQGYIGNLPVTEFGAIGPALRDVQAGEYAGPFQIAEDYYLVLRVLGRTESRALSFREAEPQVRDYVFRTRRQQQRTAKITELKSRYNAYVDLQRLNTLSFEL